MITPKNGFGDFTNVAEQYKYRPQYPLYFVNSLAAPVRSGRKGRTVADIGAGTGSLVQSLALVGLKGYAVEPNSGMFSAGQALCSNITEFEWLQATAEQTTLCDQSVDWICVSTAFHWTNTSLALLEFNRILKRHGWLSIIYKLKGCQRDKLQEGIDGAIDRMFPGIQRARPPILNFMPNIETILLRDSVFENCVFTETFYTVQMRKQDYLLAWESEHDLREQMTSGEWRSVREMIDKEVGIRDCVDLIYWASAWTVQKHG